MGGAASTIGSGSGPAVPAADAVVFHIHVSGAAEGARTTTLKGSLLRKPLWESLLVPFIDSINFGAQQVLCTAVEVNGRTISEMDEISRPSAAFVTAPGEPVQVVMTLEASASLRRRKPHYARAGGSSNPADEGIDSADGDGPPATVQLGTLEHEATQPKRTSIEAAMGAANPFAPAGGGKAGGGSPGSPGHRKRAGQSLFFFKDELPTPTS